MSKTIAVFGAGPGMGRSVARRFGREGFRVALVARNQARLAAFTAELAGDGIEAAGFTADFADRDALPGVVEAITARFGPVDVLEYAPSGLDWLTRQVPVREADAASFEFPLDLLLRTPATLVRQLLPGMLERGRRRGTFRPAGHAALLSRRSATSPPWRRPPAPTCTTCTPTWRAPACTRAWYRSRAWWATATPPDSSPENWDPSLLPEPLDPGRPRRRAVGSLPQARPVRGGSRAPADLQKLKCRGDRREPGQTGQPVGRDRDSGSLHTPSRVQRSAVFAMAARWSPVADRVPRDRLGVFRHGIAPRPPHALAAF